MSDSSRAKSVEALAKDIGRLSTEINAQAGPDGSLVRILAAYSVVIDTARSLGLEISAHGKCRSP